MLLHVSMYAYKYVYTYIPKYTLLSLCNVPCMCVFRADHWYWVAIGVLLAGEDHFPHCQLALAASSSLCGLRPHRLSEGENLKSKHLCVLIVREERRNYSGLSRVKYTRVKYGKISRAMSLPEKWFSMKGSFAPRGHLIWHCLETYLTPS